MAHELRVVKIRDGNFATYRAAVVANTADAASLADEVAKSPSIDAGGVIDVRRGAVVRHVRVGVLPDGARRQAVRAARHDQGAHGHPGLLN